MIENDYMVIRFSLFQFLQCRSRIFMNIMVSEILSNRLYFILQIFQRSFTFLISIISSKRVSVIYSIRSLFKWNIRSILLRSSKSRVIWSSYMSVDFSDSIFRIEISLFWNLTALIFNLKIRQMIHLYHTTSFC